VHGVATTSVMSAPMEVPAQTAPGASGAAAEPVTTPTTVAPLPIATDTCPVAVEATTHVHGETADEEDAVDPALIAAFAEGRRTRGSAGSEHDPSGTDGETPEEEDEEQDQSGEDDDEAPPVLQCPEIPRMLQPQHASQLSLVGRHIDVLWPDDGSWWKARVVNLNPHNGMATLYYEPNARVGDETGVTKTGVTKDETTDFPENVAGEGADAAATATATEPVATATSMETDAKEEATPTDVAVVATDAADGNDAAEDDAEGEGEVEELDLREACANKEVRWSLSELVKMREEYLKVIQGGPIAPADKSAVPCPFCDRRAFKYLRSLEKHCWNEHGTRLTREQLDDFEKSLRVGKKITGPSQHRRKREYVVPELITINYDEMYNILDDETKIKARGEARVIATNAALEVTKKTGDASQRQRATLWSAAETDLCHACGEADPNFWHIEGDMIVMCDGCDSQCHLSCYGLTEAPDGDKPWFCQGCVDGVKTGDGRAADSGMCALCPVPGGILTRVQPPSRWSTDWGSDGTHAHLCCAGNLPEVIVTPSTTCAPIADMHRVKNSRMALQCGLCGLSGGCVQCSMKNCFQGFHVLCGRAANLEHIYPDREDNLSAAVFFCAEHSAPAFSQRRLKAAGLVAATGSAAAAANGPNAPTAAGAALAAGAAPGAQLVVKQPKPGDDDHADNASRLAANAAMKACGLDVERRKAQFVIRLWHRFTPFLPQPLDPVRRADLLKRTGRFAQRVMRKAQISEPEIARLSQLTDALGEAEVRRDHDAATKFALEEAKNGQHLNEGLRDYQREGVAWLAAQHAAGAGGGILGDDMGLGKTLQVLSFLQYLRDAKGESGPHLVVCPLSVLPTWVTEAKRWCPSLRAVAFHGPEQERTRLKQEVLLQGTFDVLVTTYEMLTAEQSMLAARFHFRYLVLDEAQRVKNDVSLVSQAVRRVRTTAALLLTGTPLQNNLHELRALVSVLFQDVLEAAGAEKMDSDGNAAFGDDTAVAAARSLLQPLMLRRTKANVLAKILPKKTETVVRIPLSEVQRKLYKVLLEGEQGLFGKLATTNATSEKEALDNGRCIGEQNSVDTSGAGASGEGGGGGGNVQFTKLSNLLMQLRKVCCHPFLFGEEASREAIAAHGGNRAEALIASSGKLTALDSMLPRLRAGGHKVLIFSQFTLMLDMLEEFCDARGFAHLRLDGSTSLARRRYETALFNKSDGRHFVYLCSTRAGGLGINLQSADTVILADPDWNPTYDQQAQDRAHRLGQKRPVTVIRMCHAHSVEEGILAVAARKASLAAAVLAGLEAGADIEALDAANAAAGTDPAASAKLSFTELREIIMAGAGAVADAKTPGATDKKTRGGGGSSSDFKTPGSGKGGAQEEGVAALQRAAAGSGKKGHYNWEGHDYQKSKADADKRDIADVWVSSVGTKRRERISTVEYIDAGAGLGMQAVSRISIREAKEAEDRERRAAAAREEARAKSADRASRHETNCCECGGDEAGCLKPPPPFLAPEIAAERLRCRNCPRVMSLGCARLVTRPRMGWQCPQHHCKSCNRTASEAGGLMFRCVQCPTAFCAECNGETPFDAVEGNIPWEQLGFYLPKSFEYVMCGECCSTNEAKAKAAAIETPKEEKKEMPASAKKPRKR
jgi:SWI/SNF-related matrix-associated actin-dependent regulator of chromatin subfamily A member 5